MRSSYDPGPPEAWAALFSTAPLDHYIKHPSGRFRTSFGPVYYRGRLDGTARVLIIGQDPSTDEILAHRTLVGDAGQRVQGLLRKLGIATSYLMLNTFLFGIRGQFDSKMAEISREPTLCGYRNQLFDHAAKTNAFEALIALGNGAKSAVDLWPSTSALPVFHLLHPSAREGTAASWNANLAALKKAIKPDPGMKRDARPYGEDFQPDDLAPIPRTDLPFGVPSWHGTGGTRSRRAREQDGILWLAPETG
jgi:uracil DNA glycosylase superfamily protein